MDFLNFGSYVIVNDSVICEEDMIVIESFIDMCRGVLGFFYIQFFFEFFFFGDMDRLGFSKSSFVFNFVVCSLQESY